ncbi:MAG: sugar phosphate nucleotidyltransferase [Candidatus Eisenbacteria bacterium]
MKAMILAAGLGTRMRPLSRVLPKPLLPIEGRPLLYWHLRFLKQSGVTHAVVNAHHLGVQLNQWVDANTPGPGHGSAAHELPPTRVLMERDLLGTAGGIGNARLYLDGDSVVVMNVDQLFRPRLGRARDFHRSGRWLATLFLVRNPHLAQVRVDGARVTEIASRPDPTDRSLWAFTGTYLLSEEAIARIPRSGTHEMGPILRRWISESKVGAVLVEDLPWREVGTPETYLEAARDIALGLRQELLGDPSPAGQVAVPGFGFIEQGATVAESADVAESIILAGARVEAGARLRRVILASGGLGVGAMERVLVADGVSRGLSLFSNQEEDEINQVLRDLEWAGTRHHEYAEIEGDRKPQVSLRMITAGGSTRQIARGALYGGTFVLVRNPQVPAPSLALPGRSMPGPGRPSTPDVPIPTPPTRTRASPTSRATCARSRCTFRRCASSIARRG